ncbi:hypothetical protein PR048_011399 [Dryococelus australis]|uniref:Uncharacterized protein n=1 Tax=Dryococelus australis TaxID=614101 RepID=A0ABQ9HMS2_9NEOP|nr:hypothetical protein PR048_011399 [Dryococelus australis]
MEDNGRYSSDVLDDKDDEDDKQPSTSSTKLHCQMRTRVRTDLKCTPNEDICGIYFDDRKDDTMFVEKVNAKHFRRNRKEEHYYLIQEPGSTYTGHLSPFSSSSTDITRNIISHLSEHKISLEKLHVIGCDGTVTY